MYNFKEVETKTLEFWKKEKIHKKVKEKNKGKKKFYFLDGPPYTSGKVHIGTAWNKSMKDAVLRFKRMKGFDVWDRAGYDMHGLPTENATLKKLKIKTKEEVEKLGVAQFIKECKNLSIENMKSMNQDFERLGVWMDFENAYQSITNEFIEGEWWLIKKAHEQGRLYEGLRTMTWCPITESALAKHELEYKSVKDDSIFVKFKVKGTKNEYLIIWTTTPWTIPLNLAVMVNPEVEYVKAKVDNEIWYVAGALAGVFIQGVADKKYKVLETLTGNKLEGLEYEHPFYKYLKSEYDQLKKEYPKVHTVILSSEYVDTSSGSGLVHCAPGCGPEDYEVGHRENIPPFNPIDTKGVFPKSMDKFAGLTAKKDDQKFVDALEEAGALIAKTEVEHEYPHDWRHHKPVIFRTTKQWFFRIEDLKDEMIKENQKIRWVPHAAFNAFDSWLKNLRDNSISKQRYWGTPLPVWRNEKDPEDYIVVGSIKELEKLSGKKVSDLHIPEVDKLVIKKGNKIYKRVPDIVDVWVDAGTTSWNCLDYPHKKDLFEELWPADFILEGKDQIRGWFNLLLVASMIGMGKPSFKNVYMHGFIQDSLGRKMAKSLGNYILPEEVIEKYGADTFRYYSIGGTSAGTDLNYNFEDMKVKNRYLSVYWNLSTFLETLVGEIKTNPLKIKPKLGLAEYYMLSKLNSNIKKITKTFEDYELEHIPELVEEILLELSRTYIQFVRDKANYGSKEEKETVAYVVALTLLESLKLFAPIIPFITEEIYQRLRKVLSLDAESIHLLDWPNSDESRINPELEDNIKKIKQDIQKLLSRREEAKLGVRWPLSKAEIPCKEPDKFREFKDLVETQVNVKEVIFSNKIKDIKLDITLSPTLELEGFAREVIRRIQNLRKAAKLKKEDRIELFIRGDFDLSEMAEEIMEKVGAESLEFGKIETEFSIEVKIKDQEFFIGFNILK